jgi:hypothetical protein
MGGINLCCSQISDREAIISVIVRYQKVTIFSDVVMNEYQTRVAFTLLSLGIRRRGGGEH